MWACLLVTLTVIAVCVSHFLRETLRKRDVKTGRRVCVLVVGDIGHSPRMQYHALSLSRRGYHVTFVGGLGTKPYQDVLLDERIRIVPIEVDGLREGPRVLKYVTKVMVQSVQMLYVLMKMDLQSYILMQNPPGLPGIAVVHLVCAVRGSKFIIDWHNYGYSVLALSHGLKHPVVRLVKWYERFFGPLATCHLCVTNAMKDDLMKNWGIKAATLYDKPPAMFRETPIHLQHQLFMKLSKTYPQFQPSGVRCEEEEKVERTAFTCRNLADGTVTLSSNRPTLLLSSTSWTEDEDFSILLKALEEYDGFIRKGTSLPSLMCVITGKGQQKDYYRKLIEALNIEHVKICTPWLEAEDYPVLLGSADLGVCLHKSSSGLDLPMKVVDMFGCCLPVCAIHFNCLHELVEDKKNGLVFKDFQELSQHLKSLLSDFPSTEGSLGRLRSNLRTNRGPRWDHNWDQIVLPLITTHQ